MNTRNLKNLIKYPKKFKGEIKKFNDVFNVEDPWGFKNSRYETKRFDLICSYVKDLNPENILELGSAEGFLTEKLDRICKDILAIDISQAAVDRAKKKIKGVKMVSGDFVNLPIVYKNKYSLVIAAEVLYYQKETDLRKFFRKIECRYLISSNFWTVSKHTDKITSESGFLPIKSRWIFHLDNFYPKATHVVLWEKK